MASLKDSIPIYNALISIVLLSLLPFYSLPQPQMVLARGLLDI